MTATATQQKKGGRPRSTFYHEAHRISDALEPKVARAFLRSMRKYSHLIDIGLLERALRAGDIENVVDLTRPALLGATVSEMDEMRQALYRASVEMGEATALTTSVSLGVKASFNAIHPNVVMAARLQTADLIVRVTETQKELVRTIIALGSEQGLTPRTQATMIREFVGLRPDHAAAPGNLAQEIRDNKVAAATGRRISAADKQRIRSRIAKGTVTEEFISDVTGNYTASLKNYRAQSIARTETLRAVHIGQTESWKQAQAQGALPPTARRVWIVTPDDRLRETHYEAGLMNEEGVGLNEPFRTPLGNIMHPPLEPMCRCSVGLIFVQPRGLV